MEHYGFFNGDQEYGQEEFSRYFDSIYQSGISVNDDGELSFNVYGTGNTLTVGKGFAIIKGFYLYNDSNKIINLERDSNYDRIDRVVIRLNISTSKVSLEIKKGNPESNPTKPNLQRDNLIYELGLAEIRIPRNGSIHIKDERHSPRTCGAIRPKNLSEFNDMIKSFTEQFEVWFTSQQSKGWRNIFIQNNIPDKRIKGSIWIKTLI
ncbi:hypothetical protein [Clostridium perfringens]|uniref:Uncharacterized protein n=1 Tax=Clostridium perfringens TaxID=1502 RepID=A0A133NBQ1_CLOPF|nr:hypothetical protein [Clostridium perfringens]ELU5587498.1 hypothetical protein [Clostridium perfringens]KXA13727.1 hypothetical protein HMPREF3222_00804 [Clostridium perfringens]MDK0978038.1 hypothetical protein [Clostridium perfringens]